MTPQGVRCRIPPTFGLDGPLLLDGKAVVRAGLWGKTMQYLPGWTVQCINPDCNERGNWIRVKEMTPEDCPNCGAPLRNVPPPLAPLRMRPRPLMAYRPRRSMR